jgi:hypothetical protein
MEGHGGMILAGETPDSSTQNDNLKNPQIKCVHVTNDTVETSIINHCYYSTTPCETVNCDSDGMTGN